MPEPSYWEIFLGEVVKPSTVIALGAAVFSAYFGSRTAYALTKRDQDSKQLREDWRAIERALSMCFTIANTFISIKKQMVQLAALSYENELLAFQRFLELRDQGKAPAIFTWQADLQSFPPVRTPAADLSTLVTEKIWIRGRGYDAVQRLLASENQFNGAVAAREAAIQIINEEHDRDAQLRRYFGLPMQDGSRDERFKSALEGIIAYTNDCIFFAKIATEDLQAHGVSVSGKASLFSRKRLPKLSTANWSEAQSLGLIPSNDDYASWLKGFVRQRTGWEQIREFVFGK